MSGTPNPNLVIREVNGSLRTTNDTGEGVMLKLGTGSAYLRGVPVRCGSLAAVSLFGVGTLVSSASPQIEFGQRSCYVMQVNASTPGTFGAVTKSPVSIPQSPSTLALSAATFSARTDGDPLPSGAALSVSSGFSSPPSPLKGTIVIGAGGVAHTATWTYFNEAGDPITDVIAISGVGTFSTTGYVKQSISYSTNVDPQGTTTLSFAYAGPLDRFDHIRIKVVAGGQISVSGATPAQIQWSADDGETYSSSLTVPSTGIVDLYTYAGGFTKWHTGIRCTFTQGTVATTLFGAFRAPGATTNGDVVATFAVTGATFQVVIPTVPTSLAFSNVGSAVVLTAGTTGGTAATYAGFGNNLAGVTFTSAIVGTGGNAITVRTVSSGATSVTVIGNAITINFNDGVTTVAQIKALFPVATTFGSVTATGGTNANVLTAAADVNAATNLATGTNATVTTTGQAAVNFFNTDTSVTTLAARQYIARLTIVGTGAGLLATVAATGAANGGIAWTSKKPLVKVRHLVSGNNTAENILVTGGDGVNSYATVTIVSATDADGAETSTPNSVLTTLALTANASAAALLSGTVTGAGTGIIGNWDYVTMISAMAAGDEWTSYTTPPQMTLADLQTVWQTLRQQYQKTLANVELVHICQDNIDDTTAQSFASWLQGIKNDKKLPLWGAIQGLYKLPSYTTDTAWSNAFISALPSPRNNLLSYHGGRIDTIVSLYGCQLAMNVATLFMARCMNVIISQSSSQVRCAVRSSDGTQYALPGTGLHSVGDGTDEQTAIWEGDDSLLDLHAQNVCTPRTWAKKDGVFIRQSLMYVDDGDQMIYWERRRIMNRAWNVTSGVLTDNVNRAFLTNPDGTVSEIDAQQLERSVRAALNSGGLLNDNGVNHVSNYDFSVNRVERTALTENVDCALSITPRAKAVTITETMGFAITVGS